MPPLKKMTTKVYGPGPIIGSEVLLAAPGSVVTPEVYDNWKSDKKVRFVEIATAVDPVASAKKVTPSVKASPKATKAKAKDSDEAPKTRPEL